MESRRDLAGTEFDWFAVDQEGHFALFATAGAGPIPDSVRDSLERHDALADGIPITGWGTNKVWNSYAQVGLFAYGWDDRLKAYVRVVEPGCPLETHLGDRLQASHLPRLPFVFRSDKNIRISAADEP